MKTVFVNYNMHLFTGLRNPSHRIFQVRYMSEDKINKLKEASPIADSKAKLSEEDEEKKKVLAAIDPKELHAKFIQNHMSFEDARAAAQKAYSLQKQSLEDRFEGIKLIFNGRSDTPREAIKTCIRAKAYPPPAPPPSTEKYICIMFLNLQKNLDMIY